MNHSQLALVSVLLAAPSFSQTITREYRTDQVFTETDTGTTDIYVSAGPSQIEMPTVVEGPQVQMTEIGFTMTSTVRAEADYTNTTAAPVTFSTGVSDLNYFAIVGFENGCGMGASGCAYGCPSGGGSITVPASSTVTDVAVDTSNTIQDSVRPIQQFWPCLVGQPLRTESAVSLDSVDASAIRATAELFVSTYVRAELALNPGVASSCAGTPNSLGLDTTLEYFGSTDAGTRTAAARVSQLPAGVPAACIITNAFDATPIGVGTVPTVCLRGTRVFQSVQFTESVGAAGEAIFDLDLGGLTPGTTFAVQVAHRDTVGGWNTSNMLTGTAQ